MRVHNINQVNHFQYVTCEIIEKIIEWAMISKYFFGADFAKCKKIIANCLFIIMLHVIFIHIYMEKLLTKLSISNQTQLDIYVFILNLLHYWMS
jgi:cytochrome b subunit of formate dehydrogenase